MTDIEQERTEFEAWAANIGFSVTGKYAETIDVLCAESAFKAGYKAGRAALTAQPMPASIKETIIKALIFLHDAGEDQDACDNALNWLSQQVRT